MNPLNIEATESSPNISFDADSLKLLISGESRPEDVRSFYEPVLEWLQNFKSFLSGAGGKEVSIDFMFEYFNSSSAKYIMDIMSTLGKIKQESSDTTLKVNWHYDEMDEDMLEAGQEFESITEIPFNYIIIEE